MLKIYNTLSRKIEEFVPIDPPNVGFYSCGPTVYHFPHIGNLRTYINNDLLHRVLIRNGYKVKQVMNITDVGHLVSDADTGEDKMEKGAKREGKTVWEIAKFYTDDFFDSLKKLNILSPEVVCRATDHIKEMIDLIQQLEHKGYTYRTDDGIYFDTGKLKDYGKLAKLDIEGLKAGARVDMVLGKKNPTDFALWKFTPNEVRRQMEWSSPWGMGFPGWHIECSAMSMKYLGSTLDIHSGGIDHIPVHHTNEIAQSESATGSLFSKYWVHFAHLLVNDTKMSKSQDNFYTKSDIESKGFDMVDLRYLSLQTHYRTTMNFTWKSITGASKALKRLKAKINSIKVLGTGYLILNTKTTNEYLNKFDNEINNDLNIPGALAVLWEVVESKKISDQEKFALVLNFDQVLGLGLDKVEEEKEILPNEINSLIAKREEYRKSKQWEKADEARKEIEKLGYMVEDTTSGIKVHRK